MLYENRRRLSQIAVLALFIIVLVLIASYTYNFLSTAVITIKTSSPSNVVKIEQVSGSTKGNPVSKQAQSHLSLKVKPGQYEISVYNQSDVYGSSQVINIKARQHLSFTLNPSPISYPEPVYGSAVSSVFSDGSQLLFIPLEDSETTPGAKEGNIIQVEANNINTLLPNNNFTHISWVNSSLGLAEDSENNLYVINGGTLSQLSLPLNPSQSQLSSDISKNGNVYVSNGKDVYLAAPSGAFKKIYSSNGSVISEVVASNNSVAVIMHTTEGQEESKNGNGTDGAIAIVSNNGKSISKPSQDISSASWSPSGKYLLVESGSSAYIYSSSLQAIKSIEINNANNFTWLNDSTLFYSVSDQIWTLDLQTQQSHIVTTLALKQNIVSIYVSKDGSYLYFSENNGQETQLFRVGLKGQATNNALASLSVFLPETIGSCSLNYVNFTQPTILITYPASVSQQSCLSLAQSELQTYNLNINDVQYKYIL